MNRFSSNITLPLVALSAGIMLCYFAGFPVYAAVAILLAGLGIYLFLLAAHKNPILYYRLSKWHYLWICLVFTGIGVINADLSRPMNPDEASLTKYVAMCGRVRDIANRTNGDRLLLDVECLIDSAGSKMKTTDFHVFIYSDAVSCNIDDIVTLPMELTRIHDSENTFSAGYAENLAAKGIFYSQKTDNDLISIAGRRTSFAGISISIRDKIVSFIEKRRLAKPTKYFLITILTGDRAYLDEPSRQMFASAGIAHIIALSGMHVAIISSIFLFILFPLNFRKGYRFRMIFTVAMLWIYAFITGMAPSTVRAVIMMTAMTISILLERKGNTFNTLCIAALIILVVKPADLLDIGFQLSFLCVLSLILFANRFNPIGMRRHPAIRNICGAIIASIATTFATWIVAAYYFGFVPLMFLPSNLLILPLLPIYVTAALIFMIVEAVGINLPLMARVLDFTMQLLHQFLETITGGSENVLHADVPLCSVFLWLGGILLLVFAIYGRRKKIPAIASGVALLCAVILIPVMKKPVEKGFIFCDTYSNVEIRVKKQHEEYSFSPPVNSISIHKIYDKKILSLDCPLLPAPEKAVSNASPEDVDFIILTGSCGNSLEEISRQYRARKIIVHPSVRRKRELELMAEADSLSIPFHSLRLHRPLKILVE